MTEPEFVTILRNNVIWLDLRDRRQRAAWGSSSPGCSTAIRRESLAKTFMFLPLAISLVGASVIWRFVYAWQPAGPAADRPPQRHLDGLRRRARRRG